MVGSPQARIVSIGDELLCGRTVDTNAHDTQVRLLRRGVPVIGVEVVLDTDAAIAAALERTVDVDLVVVTGGLGPTPDDLTVDAVCAWAGLATAPDTDIERHLRDLAAARGFPFGPHMEKQCRVPEGFTPLINPAGTAPGLVGPARGRTVVLLPGVPSEVAALWPSVEEELERAGLLGPPPAAVLRRTAGLSEPALAADTAPVRDRWPDLSWSWWLTRWGVDVQAAAAPGTEPPQELGAVLDDVLGDQVYSRELTDLNTVVLGLLEARGLTVAVAESCTGGLVGASLTDEPGSSSVFRGGILAYADDVKRDRLCVPAELLAAHGAVSGPVAEAMAAGAREAVGADIAVSVTGIAGPGGGTDAKPVGTTWFGLSSADGCWSSTLRFRSHRDRNRRLAVAQSLDALRRHLESGGDPWAGRRP